MRFLEVSLERVALRKVIGVDIVLATIDVQVLEIMQCLVEELQEVRFLDPLYLVILARFGDLNGELIVPGHCHLDFRIPVNGAREIDIKVLACLVYG